MSPIYSTIALIPGIFGFKDYRKRCTLSNINYLIRGTNPQSNYYKKYPRTFPDLELIAQIRTMNPVLQSLRFYAKKHHSQTNFNKSQLNDKRRRKKKRNEEVASRSLTIQGKGSLLMILWPNLALSVETCI